MCIYAYGIIYSHLRVAAIVYLPTATYEYYVGTFIRIYEYSQIRVRIRVRMHIGITSNDEYWFAQERADVEWKFARSKLFVSFFEEAETVPPPFNLFPTWSTLHKLVGRAKRGAATSKTVTNGPNN